MDKRIGHTGEKLLKKKCSFVLLGVAVLAGGGYAAAAGAEQYYEEGKYEEALAAYHEDGDTENVERVLQAMYDLAENYRTGSDGYEKNEEEAIRYYKLVAEDESAGNEKIEAASFYLGYIMTHNETEGDDEEAASWYKKSLNKGSLRAMNNLAVMYEKGQGVAQDYEKAMTLYELAAMLKDSVAENNMGKIYEYGYCGQQINLEESLKWYKKAAENDCDGAQESVERVLQAIYDLAENYRTGSGRYEKDEEKAIRYFKLVAEDESVGDDMVRKSSFYLGYIMSHNVAEEDDAEAAAWFEKAIEKGSVSAINNLGWMYGNGKGVAQDYEKAIELFKQAADAGEDGAMNNLGVIYENGEYGQKKNLEESLKWYKQAAEKNHDGAQESVECVLQAIYDLAENYRTGSGGYEKDEEEAIRYYKLVAESNVDADDIYVNLSCYMLGWIMAYNETEEDDAEAVSWFGKATEKGEGNATNWLGYMYENGKGVPQDYEQAVELYKKAADAKSGYAQNKLGEIYENGDCGQEINLEEAMKWYKQAAEKDYDGAQESVERLLQAMYDLAGNYRDGKNGVEKNEEEAIRYYKLVAEDESAEDNMIKNACYLLGYIMSNNEAEEDNTEAVTWFEKAIEKGSVEAITHLGSMYANGKGVPQNDEKAVELYKQAADAGEDYAMNNLGWIYENGEYGQEKNLVEALKWYKLAAEKNHDGAQESVERVKQALLQ